MSAAKHTPGPWQVLDHQQDGVFVLDAGTRTLAKVVYLLDPNERLANARLIAAAPEMLAKLKLLANNAEQSAFEDWLTDTRPSGAVEEVQHQWEASHEYADFVEAWGKTRDLIAKATGSAS